MTTTATHPAEWTTDGYCPYLLCLLLVPHAHPVCPDCGAVRYGNITCATCVTARGDDLNPHRLLPGLCPVCQQDHAETAPEWRCHVHGHAFVYDRSDEWQDHDGCPVEGCRQGGWTG